MNYFYGIPHFATTIAVRRNNELLAGVVHDPMRDETWTVEAGGPALLNGRQIEVSARTELSECIISMGVSKTGDTIDSTLPAFNHAIRQVKKMRMLGSAALDIAYVATGRRATINNIDATLVAEEPKIGPHFDSIRQSLALILGLPVERIGLKATTNEGLGSIGRGEGIAAMAIATVERPA